MRESETTWRDETIAHILSDVSTCVCVCEKLTAIKLLLTEPRPFSALLKCSMTSQLDFFGVVVVAVVNELIIGDCNDGTCNSSDICGDRDCRNEVERRAIPLREFASFSC